MQVYVDEIPTTPNPPLSWKIHVAFSDDRDFRRMDGPEFAAGNIQRVLASRTGTYPGPPGKEFFYDASEGKSLLGDNAINETIRDAERSSVYFSTASWEDRFFTVKPTTVTGPSGDPNGSYMLTFNPPPEFPGGTSPLIVACIVEMRYGLSDDDVLDDVLFTETAFASLNGTIVHYDDDTIPLVDNNNPDISLIWPSRARRGDYIYIVGDGFFLRNPLKMPDGVSGIAKIKFENPDGISDVMPTSEDTPILFIGSRVIRCEVPSGLPNPSAPRSTTVTVFFEGATINKSKTFTLDLDSAP
jgi:hypothetical protein